MQIGIIALPQVGTTDTIIYPTHYAEWVRMSGATPVVISCYVSKKELYTQLQQVNGIVFTGGDIAR